MKKLFISAPMKGRTEAQIRATMEQMHHIAEAVFGEELEVIQTYISDDPPADANQAVWYLGESIKKMADADYFIGIYDEEKAFRGCAIENLVARSYNIPSYVINFGFVAPDVTEARAKANRKYNSYYLSLIFFECRVSPWSNVQPVSAHVANGGSKETARFIFLMCNLGG